MLDDVSTEWIEEYATYSKRVPFHREDEDKPLEERSSSNLSRSKCF